MRINDHQVIQLIDAADRADDKLVFCEDYSGVELLVAKADWPAIRQSLDEANQSGMERLVLATPGSGEEFVVAREHFPRVVQAMDYLTGTPGPSYVMIEISDGQPVTF